MARLPKPGENDWGGTLNDYLLTEHNPDGTLKKADLIDSAVQQGDLTANVKDYGAKGDGTTDDTAAIQSAIDAVYNQGGGEVLAPQGTYIVRPTPGIQVKSNVVLRGVGKATVFKIANGTNTTGNLIKSESWADVVMCDFCVDGNRAGQTSGTNYGVYVAGAANTKLQRLWVHDTTGVGIHIYNSDGVMVSGCESQGNLYHGFEVEQSRGCVFQSNRGTANDYHGLLISPGERGGTGSAGNSFMGNTFDNNLQYGIASNAANGDISAWLNKGNVISGNQVYANHQYGIQMFKQDNTIITGNFVYNNHAFGIYLYQSQNNVVTHNILLGNSQSGAGAYDEILLEGYNDNNAHPSSNNNVSHNTIIMGGTKARWAINEATAHDGPNTFANNTAPAPGTAGAINRQSSATVITDPAGVQQVYGNQAIQGANAGLDNAFTNVLRVYNNFPSGETQVVTPNGPITFWAGGAKHLDIDTNGYLRMSAPTSAPTLFENGSVAFYLDESGNNLKVAVKYSNGTTKTGTVSLS